MSEALLCDGEQAESRFTGPGVSAPEAGELAARAVRGLLERHPQVGWAALDDLVLGLPGPDGEGERARAVVAGARLPANVTVIAVRRGSGCGLDAVSVAARAIKAGEAELVVTAVAGEVPDGAVASALLFTSEAGAQRHGLTPLVRVVATTLAGAPGRAPGGCAAAVERVLERAGIWPQDVAVFEVGDGAEGRSDAARAVLGAARRLVRCRGRYAVSAAGIGADQGIAVLLERV
jgi:acetyl-CoA acetyltransferase